MLIKKSHFYSTNFIKYEYVLKFMIEREIEYYGLQGKIEYFGLVTCSREK